MKAALIGVAAAVGCVQIALAVERVGASQPPTVYQAMVARHARANGVPERLIHRIIMRESRYNPAARNRNYYGMMQIAPSTAKTMGYRGAPGGLLDADTNLTYAVRYLAGAYRVAGGDENRAVNLYASGYYYDAKRKGMLDAVGLGRNGPRFASATTPPPDAATQHVADAMSAFPTAAQVRAPGAKPAAAEAAPQAVAAATIPLPPVRDPSPAVVATATPRNAAAARVDVASAPAVVASAVPLPPVRDVAPVVVAQRSAPEEPRSFLSARKAPAPQPVANPSPEPSAAVAGAAATVPLPPVREAAPAATALASAAPTPPVRPAAPAVAPVKDVAVAARGRVISAGAEPVLAGAGPIMPSRPRAPSEPAAPAAPALAYAGPSPTQAESAPPRPWFRGPR